MKVTLEINNILIIDEYSSCFPTMVGLFFSFYFLGKPTLKQHFHHIRISVFQASVTQTLSCGSYRVLICSVHDV